MVASCEAYEGDEETGNAAPAIRDETQQRRGEEGGARIDGREVALNRRRSAHIAITQLRHHLRRIP